MRIISPNNPVIIQGAKQPMSNASGCGCKDDYSNGDGVTKPVSFLQAYSNEINPPTTTSSSPQKTLNPDLVKAGGDIFTQLGTALIGRQRTYTDVEQKCGKKPKVGKKAIEAWNKCASSADLTPAGAPTYTGGDNNPPAPTGMSKGAKIGLAIGGLAVVGLVIFLVAKSGKSKGK